MKRPITLPAFTEEEYQTAKGLLATRVATMMGRKFEEGDWAHVYCTAKGIPHVGWSNLNIDIMHNGQGVEQKMLKKTNEPLKKWCGTSLMHPAATRSIRIPVAEEDPNEVMRDILTQYAELIAARRDKIREESPGVEPDMRTGWLLWQDSLEEFLYFEEEMLPPDPDDYIAQWKESGGGTRKASRNLWLYEKETGHKRFSITTTAGAKIQSYFDVPPPTDPNLYFFRVQGEEIAGGLVRIWITVPTGRELKRLIGDLTVENVSSNVIGAAAEIEEVSKEQPSPYELALAVSMTEDAYEHLKEAFPGVSDEHRIRLLIQHIHEVKA